MERYDRSIRMYDEPQTPEALERLSREGTLGRGRLLSPNLRFSFWRQMATIWSLRPASVLEIGPGEGAVSGYFRTLGIVYDTLDITETPAPTYRGSLATLEPGAVPRSYDVVCAFQVLEHMPFEEFSTNLRKMAALSNRHVFISLPYDCGAVRLDLRVSLGRTKRWWRHLSLHLPLWRRNRRYREGFRQEFPWAVHYWEVGRRSYPLRRILEQVEAADLRVREQGHGENPFHYFLLLEKVVSR